VTLSFNELRELVAALNQTDIAELTLKNDGFELTLRKPSALQPDVVMSATPVAPAPVLSSAPAAQAPASPAPQAQETEPAAPPAIESGLVEITAPMVGTFYRSPAPDESSFVEVGDRIQSGQTVLEAEVSGEIVDILVENAEPIEFGQPLMRVRPSK